MRSKKQILINSECQQMICYENDEVAYTYTISTGKNGLGEQQGSECTPRGLHQIHSIIGAQHDINSVFVAREWTGELYSAALAERFPGRDWILTRILRLEGLEYGRNQGGDVDTLERFIYIHGTPDTTVLGVPGSRGCIRMGNQAIIALAEWVHVGTQVLIK
ncbi:MAG: L,D-transpeptidase [Legionellaceae bacterium]|nr:L,D-transpeptidase [Legionellaceae bacterium]